MKKTKKDLSPKTNNSKNLNLIINSDNYKLAYEDIDLLSRNAFVEWQDFIKMEYNEIRRLQKEYPEVYPLV